LPVDPYRDHRWASGTDGLPEGTIELAGPKAHYFFGCGWTADSLDGGTMFFRRM
jgi:hypothetical protein